MDLGTVTLLELNQAPHGKRVAYCLPTGEFIFATSESARCFSSSPDVDVQDLYGRNLCQFLAPHDIEKLEDYMRGHCAQNGNRTLMVSDLQMMARVHGTGTPIWIRLQTIPLTLRMSRCIDAVKSMCNPAHLFADSSSFIISEEDLPPVLLSSRARSIGGDSNSSSLGSSLASPYSDVGGIRAREDQEDDDLMWSDQPPFEEALLPLELKDSPRAGIFPFSSSTTRHPRGGDRRHGKRTASSVSTELADDEELSADESLADFAFEADWAGEVARESLRRSSADLSLRAAPVI